MCGIAGFSGNFSNDLLIRMSEKISHRGPDDDGLFYDAGAGIGMAHRRLSIIDTSSLGHQPMWNNDKNISIVFNGEIFNYQELRKDLHKDGVIFNSNSDTEVLLYLYQKHGKDLLSFLNGMFAFAIWDTRSKELFVARDGVGIKPFYYSVTNKGFLFSSELKSLLQEESVIKELDPEAIKCYLTYLWSPSPRTMVKSIKKLEPGYAMVVKNGGIDRAWKYYELPYNNSIRNYSENEAIETVRHKVETAVGRQLVSDVPVGCFLSGGLDSSAIAAIAKTKYSVNDLQCYTIGIEGKGLKQEGMTEDLPYAKRVAKYLGVNLNIISVDSGMIDFLEKMIYHLDEPQADPAPLNALFICEKARQMGSKVLLSGAGGDDIFTGYRRHYALMQEKYWAGMPYLARKAISKFSQHIPVSYPLTRRLNKAFRYAHLSANRRVTSYFDWIGQDQLKKIEGPLLKGADSFDVYSPLLESIQSVDKGGDMVALNKMLLLEGKHFLADHNLNYTDKVSMASGVEVRVPLLDKDLIDYATTLPLSYKQRGKIGKWIFKKSMETYLPNDIIYRPKTGFGAPLRYWLKNELKPLKEELLSEKVINNRGIFEYRGVKKLMELDQKGKVDASYSIFSIMMIELWIRIFFENNGM